MSSDPTSLEERLARVERALATISNEVVNIRSEVGRQMAPAAAAVSAAPAVTAPTAAVSAPPSSEPALAESSQQPLRPPFPQPQPTTNRQPARLDFEALLGRYGMLAIAVLAAVFAVGTFLSWAWANGYLHPSPVVRVILGLIAAAALGTWGFRLRRRERSFGSAVMGLALVIVLVCAYAAGPGLALVPTWLAFVGAAIVSWALAIFAHLEADEPLWCVAFGGAALAPFVTSSGEGNIYALLIYAAIVLFPACFAISQRDWPIGWRVFYGAAALFSIAAASVAWQHTAPAKILSFALPLAIGALGVVPSAPVTRSRGALRWLGLLSGLGAAFFSFNPRRHEPPVLLGAALLLALVAWLALVDREADVPQSSIFASLRGHPRLLDWMDVALVPLFFAYTANRLWDTTGLHSLALSIATVVLAAFLWRRAPGGLRDASAFAVFVLAGSAISSLGLEEPLGLIVGYVALGLAALAASTLRPTLTFLISGLLTQIWCALASVDTLADRHFYRFTPFLTEASATALAVLVGLVITMFSWRALRTSARTAFGEKGEARYATRMKGLLRAMQVAPWVWAFVWITIELSMAWSESTSILLLVVWFALCAVACVGVGRAKRSARLRQVGLALALLAAATAFYGATTWFDFLARILAYLVTSAFLLGIAYWYRRPGRETDV